MYHENSIKENSIIISICVILYLFSPSAIIPVSINEVQAKEVKTASGALENRIYETVSSSGKTNKNMKNEVREKRVYCDKDCKIKTLIGLGMNKSISSSLVNTCKIKALDACHCIIVGSSILKSESNLGTRCNGKNCFGMGGGAYKYKTYEEGVEDWVERYSKYWYKAKSASFFYPSVGNKSPSRYCTSEESSGSKIGCPNGQKHAQGIWNKLEKIF